MDKKVCMDLGQAQNFGVDHGESRFVCTGYRVGWFKRLGPAGADPGPSNDAAGSRR
jgi:hypothetical protein